MTEVENAHTSSDAGVHLQLAIPHTALAAAVARRVIHALGSLGIWSGRVDEAILMVSELATNAYVHTRGPMLLQVSADRTAARVEVRDSGGDSQPQTPDAPEDDNGRGLKIVAELADEWGVIEHDDGHTVWFGLKTS